MNSSLKASLAMSAAALFIAGCSKGGESAGAATADAADAADVKCMGVNECKGQGACGVPGGHSCAGQNECKGKGWIKVSQADCDAQGGTVL